MTLPRATTVARATTGRRTVSLDYEGRLVRRRRLSDDAGEPFLVDLAETVSLDHGDALVLEDGSAIEVVAATEPLLEVTGPNLPRLAWHIGNRHTPCQIEADRLLIAEDHVLEAMLKHLRANVRHVNERFRPEGGAYGHGRTFGHEHGPADGHSHGPSQSHDDAQDHFHQHTHSRDHGHG